MWISASWMCKPTNRVRKSIKVIASTLLAITGLNLTASEFPSAAPLAVTLDGEKLTTFEYSAKNQLLWIHFENQTPPRELTVCCQ
jgi:hypothetical protein